jgi:hypothetical protein
MHRWIKCAALLGVGLVASTTSFAQLEYGKDYTDSDALYSVTHVKVASNMLDVYLEGIRQTWINSNEVAKGLGHIQDYAVYSSLLPDSGDYNLTLVVSFKDLAQYELGRKEFQKFEEAWLKQMPEEKQREIVATYPNVRTIVGEYLVRQLQFK